MASNSQTLLSSYEQELIERVLQSFPNKNPRKFIFFYTNKSPFSNFYPATIEDDGIQYHCTEQYMMYHKAKLFHDEEIAETILQAKKPGQCKSLGRQVANFDQQIWIDNRVKIVRKGNFLKFTQNEDLKKLLLKPENALFVEASPGDRIWGVGLRETDFLIHERSNWKGLNLQGYLLTDIALELRQGAT